MAWDWEKLNQQQRQHKGGPPPQVDDIIKQFKNLKLPGGTVAIFVLLIAVVLAYSSIFTIKTGYVGVIQQFG